MPRIVIAGGGVAGLEALAALRAHLGAEPVIELVDGAVDLVERQWSVTTPFGGAPPRRFDLAEIARDLGAHLRPDHLLSVDVPARRLRTVRGDVLDFDALLVAVGARHDVAVPGALTFSGPRDAGAFAGLLDDLRGGRVQRVAFAVPAGVAWTLPLYELALMTADELALRASTAAELLLVTPEDQPLDAFGPAVAGRVRALLEERAITVRTGVTPRRIGARGLELDGAAPLRVDRVVALPRLGGPWLDGLRHDADGFLVVDEHGAVEGATDVWAAGDGTSFPIKQGGLAAQQADAAAAAIAARLGAPVTPAPFRPVLRALLADRGGGRYLEEHDAGPEPGSGGWWPPSKVFSRRLSGVLADAAGETAAGQVDEVDVGALLLALAERHAAAGDRALARRCLDAAEQVLGTLPAAAAARRRQLRDEALAR